MDETLSQLGRFLFHCARPLSFLKKSHEMVIMSAGILGLGAYVGIASEALQHLRPTTAAGWAWFALGLTTLLLTIGGVRYQKRLDAIREASPDIRFVAARTKTREMENEHGWIFNVDVFRIQFCNQGAGPATDVSAMVSFHRDTGRREPMVFKSGIELFGLWFKSGDRKGEESYKYSTTVDIPPNGLPEVIDIAHLVDRVAAERLGWNWGIVPIHHDHVMYGDPMTERIPEDPVLVSVVIRGTHINTPVEFWFRMAANGNVPRIEYLDGPRATRLRG